MTNISLSIVTHNNDKIIDQTLQTLITGWPENISLSCYIIDNASTDQTVDQIAAYKDKLKIIQSKHGNVGFGAAHNLVLDLIDSDYHIIMNPDVIIDDDQVFGKIAAYLDANPDIGMLVPRIVDDKGEMQYLCRRELTVLDLVLRFLPGKLYKKRQDWHEMRDMDYDISFDVPFASGCFMVVRTGLLKELGGFDKRFFLYAEDADLSRRINQIARVVYYPEITVCHMWERASYKKWAMTRIHIKSLWKYFRKWGFKFK